MYPNSLFFKLLRFGLETEFPTGENYEYDWQQVYAVGVKQGVAAILFDGLQRLVDTHIDMPLPDKKLKMQWYAHTLQVEKHHLQHKQIIASLAKFYSNYGIRMMVLKGFGLSQLYPIPSHRPCGDIDIWLFGKEKLGDKFLHEKKGVEIDREHHHHTVFSLDGVMIENHYDFINTEGHISSAEIEKELKRLVVEEQPKQAKVGDSSIYLPPATFNALFLLRHAGEHFSSAEIAVRHLTDWAMFVKHSHNEIDWEYLEQIAKKQNMLRFMQCLNGICIDYLGLSIDLFPKWQRDKTLEKRIMNDILNPSFEDKSALNNGLLKDYSYRLRRWWGQRWKHKLVFRENLAVTFLVLLKSHFVKPIAYKNNDN